MILYVLNALDGSNLTFTFKNIDFNIHTYVHMYARDMPMSQSRVRGL